MASIKQTIQIEISVPTPFDLKPKAEALKELSRLETEVLQKLIKLSNNKKAVEMFKNNFGFIEKFLK